MRARLSAPVQTGPGAHAACCTWGTELFLEVKRQVRGVNNPVPCSVEVKERVQLYLYSSFAPSLLVTARNTASERLAVLQYRAVGTHHHFNVCRFSELFQKQFCYTKSNSFYVWPIRRGMWYEVFWELL